MRLTGAPKIFSPSTFSSSSSLWLLPRQRHQQDAIVVLVGNDRQIAARVDVYRELLRASHTQDGPHSPIEEIYNRHGVAGGVHRHQRPALEYVGYWRGLDSHAQGSVLLCGSVVRNLGIS